MQNTDVKTKSKRIIISILSLLLLICVLLVSFGQDVGIPSWNDVFALFGVYAEIGDDLSVSFINVGTADACYIKCQDTDILIDAGESQSCDKVSAYLKRAGCAHFDAVIASHPDSDHIGGMSGIIENFGTDVLYMYPLPQDIVPNTDEYVKLVNSIEENKINVISPQIGLSVQIGDLKLDFISPKEYYNNTNDMSLVVKMTYKETSFLFTGDISSEVEEDLINSGEELKSDVLKVAHHGSKTSSSKEFLEAVSPQISIVCVGSNESALPDYYTMARINKYSSELYRTDEDRTIVVTSDGKSLNVQTHA